MLRLPTIRVIRREILELKPNWDKLSIKHQKKIMKVWKAIKNPQDIDPKYMADKIARRWTGFFDPEDMVRFDDDDGSYSEEERQLSSEDFTKLKLIKLWWEKVKLFPLTNL